MARLSFISDEIERIDLEKETWVEVKKDLPFKEFSSLFEHIDSKASDAENLKVIVPLLQMAVVDWSDKKVPCIPENIAKLNTSVLIELARIIFPMYTPEKKSSTPSTPASED